MFVQIALLSKAHDATSGVFIWTLKWLFTCMDSQMIVKIMPFSENHITFFIVTFQYLEISRGLRIFKLKNSKVISLWHVLVVLKLCP